MKADRRPNILLIHVDQMRQDIAYHCTDGSYAGTLPEVALPNLDRLRREGVTMRNGFCNFPICVPSRASFITGKYPRQLRVYNNSGNLPADEPTLAHRMAKHGYEPIAIGRTHRQHRGFPRVPECIDESAYGFASGSSRQPSDVVTGIFDGEIEQQHDLRTARQFRDFVNHRDHDRPFVTMLGLMAPHPPFYPPREFAGRYSPNDIELPEPSEDAWRSKPQMQRIPAEKGWLCHTPEIRRKIASTYLDLCEYMDFCLGDILTTLEESGQLEKTIIAFIADHGEQLGEHDMLGKFHNVYEGSLRTPMVLRLPKAAHAGLELEHLVELIDLVPTLIDLASGEVPEDLPGRSLKPLFAEPDAEHRDAVHAMIENGEMIRTDRWKLAVYHDDPVTGELYDLQNDPHEYQNLFNDPAHADLRHTLMQRIIQHTLLFRPSASRAAQNSHIGSPDPVEPTSYPTEPKPETQPTP